jgi:2,4-dienoyl-CoA reductase-like NADH-dependent reductase (Old Yellow Enzyme family)/thioredoxin reductase
MTTGFGYDRGVPTDDLLDYFRARSGEVAMTTVAFGAVSREGRVEDKIPWMWRPDIADSLSSLAEAIRLSGAVPCLQLGHGGRQVSSLVTGERSVAPSPIPPAVHTSELPHELNCDEISGIVAAFGVAAKRAAEAGFQAIELHGGHGYLVQQFLSPAANRRSDGYGRDRSRFGREVIESIQVGAPDLPLIVRVNGSDLVPEGLTVEEAANGAVAFAEAGADALLVSAGVYGSVPYTIPLLDDPGGCFLDLAAGIRRLVEIPVIGIGNITTPEMAEAALVRGDCDAVAIGRALLADPDWVSKAAAGQSSDIRPCIATVQGCAGMLQTGDPISCAVNPEVGRESRPATQKDELSAVTVIGGGPAGMEAARRAAELGHEVVLLERGKRLGGQLRWASATPTLRHFESLIAWYERRLTNLGVDVRLDTPYNGGTSDGPGNRQLIVATGAEVEIPVIEGLDALATWTGDMVFEGAPSTIGTTALAERLVVLGGGQRALPTALWLAERGARVKLLSDIRFGSDTSGLARRAYLARLEKAGIERVEGRAAAFEEQGVALADGTILPCDGVVLVEPMRSARPSSAPGAALIGDARQPRDISAAIAEGRQAAESI